MQQPPHSEPRAPEGVQRVLDTALEARGKLDYALFGTVCSPQFLAFVTKEKFDEASDRLSPYFKADYRVSYMGAVQGMGRPIHFWRMWVAGWDTDILIRMALNEAGKISGLLYSPPFDTAIGKK